MGFDGGEISLVAQDWVAVRAADHAARVEVLVWAVPRRIELSNHPKGPVARLASTGGGHAR